ncbi:MAG: TetR/AcrR family transcriptional regulator [Variovorax sp.]|jgi:AcrR family transcriptional regulator|nr:MAG: TetR/AcrR family transcriptional regulator [Variovorax sp.]
MATSRRTIGEAGESGSRDEIIQAAAELFMEFGYSATSIDAVAQRLGATKGRIYHHYRSKADLFFDVQAAAMTRLSEEIEPIARNGGGPVERLSAMAFRHTQILLTELPMQKVAVQGLERHLLAAAGAKQVRSIVRMRDDYEKLFVEVIDEGVRNGDFVDLPPTLIAKPFFGALNWATVWYSQRRLQSAQAIDDIAHALANFAIRGLTNPGDDVRAKGP